jgi:phage-related protein
MEREILIYGEYFWEFYHKLSPKVQEKIEYVFDLVRYEKQVPVKFLKHIESSDGLYELRIRTGNNIFRFFCFFDEGKLVVVLNGFQKKSQKTPKKEIMLAERLKKEYYEQK